MERSGPQHTFPQGTLTSEPWLQHQHSPPVQSQHSSFNDPLLLAVLSLPGPLAKPGRTAVSWPSAVAVTP